MSQNGHFASSLKELISELKTQQMGVLFGDGACTGNPGPGGYAALWVGPNGDTREWGGGMNRTTNNEMELKGLEAGLSGILKLHPDSSGLKQVCIFLDSVYVLKGVTAWVHGWKRRGWTTMDGKPVLHQALWEQLSSQVEKFKSLGITLEFNHVKGHSGVPGNERVDVVSVAFAKAERANLYAGPIGEAPFEFVPLPPRRGIPDRKADAPKTDPSFKVFYLSEVDGKVERHTVWKDCEARVKGRPRTKYRKIESDEMRRKVLTDWGHDPDKV